MKNAQFFCKYKKYLIALITLILGALLARVAEISIGFDIRGNSKPDIYIIKKSDGIGIDLDGDKKTDVKIY